MKKIFNSFLIFTLVATFVSCETVELDLLESPTQVGQDELDPQFLFDNIQLGFGGFASAAGGFSSFTSEVTRQFTMQGSSVYAGAYGPNAFNGIWSTAYAGVLQDIQALESIEDPENYEYHIGVSKIFKAYVYLTLVDMFGDVPLDEALSGETNEAPAFQSQVDVYKFALSELDAARSLLSSGEGIEPLNDFYYAIGDSEDVERNLETWRAVANSIELRALNNARQGAGDLGIDLTDRISTLLNSDLIDSPDEDFQFNYFPNRLNPNTRHPAYSANYEVQANGYIANYLMWEMTGEKGFDDPRLRYYFYRQDTNATNEDIFTLGCAAQNAPGHYNGITSIYDTGANIPFCTADASRGYWGRDHGDDNGIPPDGAKRTVWGVYPAGGLFDANQAEDVGNQGQDGLLGAGIEPILLTTHVNFIKTEIALTQGIGDADDLLEEAIRSSMSKVINFGNLDSSSFSDFLSDEDDVEDYVDFVMDAFDDADTDGKLDITIKELHIASFGNGLEVYNAYRRTGYPSNMQPSLNPNPGDFYRSALYPANSVNNNTNSNQADRARQVFWDKNPSGFIN